MAKHPQDSNAPAGPKQKPARDPAKHSQKDPARPTRAKAARPEQPPIEPALADLLNPGIAQGTAGPGSQTGLKPPPDNSFDRRADFAAAHRAPRPEKSEGGQRLVVKSDFSPKGDQPQAIADLVEGVGRHDRTQVLLGVTGSGKTFTMAKVIEATQRPALVLAPNKTLAA